MDFPAGRDVRVRSHDAGARRRGARSARDQAALQGEPRRRYRLRIGVEGVRRHSGGRCRGNRAGRHERQRRRVTPMAPHAARRGGDAPRRRPGTDVAGVADRARNGGPQVDGRRCRSRLFSLRRLGFLDHRRARRACERPSPEDLFGRHRRKPGPGSGTACRRPHRFRPPRAGIRRGRRGRRLAARDLSPGERRCGRRAERPSDPLRRDARAAPCQGGLDGRRGGRTLRRISLSPRLCGQSARARRRDHTLAVHHVQHQSSARRPYHHGPGAGGENPVPRRRPDRLRAIDPGVPQDEGGREDA